MSKKQDRLHNLSLVRIAAYEVLPSNSKTGHTRPALVSCKRVEKQEKDMYTVAGCLKTVGNKGAGVDMVKGVIDFTGKSRETIGIKTKGKCDFLAKQGFVVIGI